MNERSKKSPFVILVGVAALAFVSTGCRDLRSFNDVEAAFESPTGSLDEGTAPTVFGASILGQKSNAANSLAASAGGVPGTVGSAMDFLLASSGDELGTNEQALFGECSPNVQFRGDFVVDKVSFDCGDTGEFTGKVTLDLDWQGEELQGFFIDYEMFCQDSSCIDGSLGVRWSLDGASGAGLTTTLIATARFEVIVSSTSYWVDWAWRVQEGDDELRIEWLVWTSPDRSGRSFVLSAVANSVGGHLEVRDADGWWRCDYGNEARDGECYRCAPEGETCTPQEGGSTFSWEHVEG